MSPLDEGTGPQAPAASSGSAGAQRPIPHGAAEEPAGGPPVERLHPPDLGTPADDDTVITVTIGTVEVVDPAPPPAPRTRPRPRPRPRLSLDDYLAGRR
ncbi:hypothetical protein [Geodermatophilus obscurus]|uniref:hypothetical protein n=1 Tax=Geodermatophilus obscurus TaxID=1861 RepID=UPI0009347AAB|nr:hypothetical protein [Geodermatophilus obscurus]